jgi:hypothetical protein
VTGPEHYARAQELLDAACLSGRVHKDYEGNAERSLAAAQVHATLALVAATAHETPSGSEIARASWREVGAW